MDSWLKPKVSDFHRRLKVKTDGEDDWPNFICKYGQIYRKWKKKWIWMLHPSWQNETKIQIIWKYCEKLKITLQCVRRGDHCLKRKNINREK